MKDFLTEATSLSLPNTVGNTRILLSGIAILAATGSLAFGQVSFTGTFSDNFDEMGTTGTTAPTGWSVYSEAGSHFTFAPADAPNIGGDPAPGVSPNFTAGALTLESTLTAGAATTQKGLVGYNFGTTAGSTDRALGTSPSGNAATILELNMTNSTGSAITAVTISYDIDRFTTTVPNTGNIPSSDSGTDPYYGVEEYPGYQLFYSTNSGSAWTNVAALNPTIAGPTGVIVPNTVGTTSVTNYALTLGSSVAPGGNLEFAWFDDNGESPSPDQLLGLNNVNIIAVPEPASIMLLGLGAIGTFAMRRRRYSA